MNVSLCCSDRQVLLVFQTLLRDEETEDSSPCWLVCCCNHKATTLRLILYRDQSCALFQDTSQKTRLIYVACLYLSMVLFFCSLFVKTHSWLLLNPAQIDLVSE